MSRRQKIVTVAVFVLLALLYTGAAATGGRSGQGDPGTRPGGLVGWLGGLVGQPPPAARSQLSSPCLSGSELRVSGDCTLTVARAGGTRRVRLHAADPVEVSSRPPGRQQSATEKVKAGADVDVTVDANGGPIGLACSAASTCTVTLP
jgi:hypothetical protein